VVVATVSSWSILPGRRAEFAKQLKFARERHEKHGGTVRIWNNAIAGDGVGVVEYWIEHASMDAYGRFSSALELDEEYQNWFAQFTGAHALARVTSTRLLHVLK
jgi:hypothetical protein